MLGTMYSNAFTAFHQSIDWYKLNDNFYIFLVVCLNDVLTSEQFGYGFISCDPKFNQIIGV